MRLRASQTPQLVDDYQAGVEIQALAHAYRINRSTVYNHIRRAGLQRRRPLLSPTDVDRAVEMYANGQSLLTISKAFDTTGNTIRLALTKRGVGMRPPSQR
jgi:DNA invertase Pin-like site-specific DNA recombinase